MSGTQTEEVRSPERDSFGITDILSRREGDLPAHLLQEDRPEPETQPAAGAENDAEAVADQLRRDAAEARTRAVAAEQRAAQEAQRARQATEEVQRTRQAAYETEYNSVTTALANAEAERDRLQTEMRSAHESGDSARMAEISLRLGELGAELVTYRQGKQAFEAERQNQLRQPQPTQATPPQTGEWTTVGVPKEQFLATRTPATQEWLRKNDKFFTDPSFFNVVSGADQMARGRGIAADTPEYFRFIEEQAGMTTPTQGRQHGSSAPPSAPPSRDAPGPTGRNNRAGDIHISAEDRRIAEWMKVDAEQYVRDKNDLYASGELPHRRR